MPIDVGITPVNGGQSPPPNSTRFNEPDPRAKKITSQLGNYKQINKRLSNVSRRSDTSRNTKRSALSLARLADTPGVSPRMQSVNPIDTDLILARVNARTQLKLERMKQRGERIKMSYLHQISSNPYLSDEQKATLLQYNVPGLRPTELNPIPTNDVNSGTATDNQSVGSLMGISSPTILAFIVLGAFLLMKKG